VIYYRNDVRASGVDGRALRSTAQRLLAAAGEAGSTLSLTIVGDAAMRELNRRHRGKDVPTDVLSFPLFDAPGDGPQRDGSSDVERMIGDVVISVDTARRQAAEYDAPLQRELERLLIHGILHVLGHDHMEPAERATMEAEERRLAGSIGMPWPYL
jgi:probable rRNA maturation factor